VEIYHRQIDLGGVFITMVLPYRMEHYVKKFKEQTFITTETGDHHLLKQTVQGEMAKPSSSSNVEKALKYSIVGVIFSLYIWIFVTLPGAMLSWICFGLWM
jgi:hypothetical protein